MINKEKVLRDYLKWVDQVTEDLEDKSVFSPEEIVYKICEIIEKDYIVLIGG